jgi:hypothetical protein
MKIQALTLASPSQDMTSSSLTCFRALVACQSFVSIELTTFMETMKIRRRQTSLISISASRQICQPIPALAGVMQNALILSEVNFFTRLELKKYLLIFTLVFFNTNFIYASERLIDQADVCASKTFKKAPQNFDNEPGAIVVKSMPRVRSQGSFGACFAYAGAVLAQHNFCKAQLKTMVELGSDLPAKFNADFEEFKTCQNLSPKNEISPMHVSTVRYDNHKRLKISELSFTDGGNTAQSLKLVDGIYGTERCYPSDILINQYGVLKTEKFMTAEQEKYAAAYARVLRAQFTEAEILADCKDCLNNANDSQIRKDGVEALLQLKNFVFDKTKTNKSEITDRKNLSENKEINTITDQQISKRLMLALVKRTTQQNKDRTFKEFMADVAFSNMNEGCKPITGNNDIVYYPKLNETSNVAQTEKKLIEILKTDKPVGINGLCVSKGDDIQGCKALHITVSAGYYQDPSSRVKYIKIHNSYGAEWQDFCTIGGWVEMDSVLSRLQPMGGRNDEPNTVLDRNLLVWIGQ